MDKDTRNFIFNTTQAIRRLLEEEFARQLEGTFDVHDDGRVAEQPGPQLTLAERLVRQRIVEAIQHRRAAGESPVDSVRGFQSEAVFTFLNRLAALKMMEARGLVLPCVSQGDQSQGFKEFSGLAPGLIELPDKGYRLYLECLFDEIGREVGVLFDRTDSASLLWPRRKALEAVLEKLNHPALAGVWAEDETIGWIYQYYNDPEERRAMRDQSSAPRNSRELAVRNQFFTPRYVVEFLSDNTLGRLWHEMTQGRTRLKEQCRYMVRRPDEVFFGHMTEAAQECPAQGVIELAKQLQQGDATSFAEFTTDDGSVQRMIDMAHAVNGFARHPGDEQTWQWVAEVRRNVFLPAAYTGATTQDILDALFLECRADRHGGDGSIYRERWFVNASNEVRRRALRSREANLPQAELLQQPVCIPFRPLKDPRTIRILDPACGSMHFGLYAFDLLETIYAEAWDNHPELLENLRAQLSPPSPPSEGGVVPSRGSARGEVGSPSLSTLNSQPSTPAEARRAFLALVPRLIIEHNLHGIDIDPRAAQIAGLALWLRAQKAWQQLGVKPAERPVIRRSNIVCAEPMPGEKELLKEFVEREFPVAERGVFLRFLTAIFDKMQLAGEAGSLLKIEEEIRSAVADAKQQWKEGPKLEQGALFDDAVPAKQQKEMKLDLSGITDEQFWERAEERIYTALRDYAEQAENGGGFQRRLFAEDAARGFAFIDVCRKRYDVALMNPPFGEASDRLLAYLDPKFPTWNRNVLCAFIQQQLAGLADGGFLASVMDRSLINKSTYEEFRQYVLLKDERLAVVLDLGWEVLDANVEVACCIARPKRVAESVTDCFDVRDVPPDSKDVSLLASVRGSEGRRKRVYTHPAASFAAFPNSAVVYDLPDSLLSTFFRFKSLKSLGLVSYTGHQLESDRHFMLFWEIPFGCGPSPDRPFCHLYNGGEYSRFCSLPQEVVRFGYFANLSPDDVTTYTFVLRNREKQFLQGVCFGVRGEFLDAHAFPSGVLFTVEGQAFPIPQPETALFLLGLLNSAPASRLLNTYCGQHKYSGYVNLLPCPPINAPKSRELACSIAESAAVKRQAFAHAEISLTFANPVWASRKSLRLSELASRLFGELQDANRLLNEHVQKNNLLVCDLYELNDEESRADVLAYASTMPSDCVPGFQIDSTSALERQMAGDIISYSTSVAFGRWDIRYATGEQAAPELPDPFAPLPVCPPGQLQNAQGLPACPEDVPAAYPVRIPWDGILVDDLNHSLDIIEKVSEVLRVIWTGSAGSPTAEAIENEACEILGVKSLRDYFRKPTAFFADHLSRYSKSRRQAPIYWPLSSPNGLYTVWLYYHRLTADTLFTVLRDHVKPKLEYEERRAFQLRQEAGPTPSPSQRRDMAEADELVEDLRAFRDELSRVAPLFRPNLNDGVIINHAPLWHLAGLPKWRKDCQAVWEALANGDYDWAHFALHLWPERVIPKCATDRSLAIAHGLDEVFWEEFEDKPGKPKKWRAKKVSDTELQKLIATRTSPAVKAALESLGGASPSEGTPRRGRKKAVT